MKLSKLVSRQIPAFIREEHPLFVKFIQKYYEFVEQNGFVDKDLSTSSQLQVLLEAIANEVAYSVPESISDQTFFLQRVKDVYLAKGSEESFRFLFRALFNKEIEFFYPSSTILRTSDGNWKQDYSIFVRVIVGNPFASVKNRVDVLSSGTKVELSVLKVEERTELGYLFESLDLGFVRELGYTTEDVDTIMDVGYIESSFADSVFEVFIDRDFYGTFKEDDVVVTTDDTGNVFVGYIVSTTAKLKVFNKGLGFRVGDLIPITTQTGNGTVLKVSSISTNGKVETVDFLKFGYEYARPIVISATSDGQVKLVIEERAKNDDDPDFVTQAEFEDLTAGHISRGYSVRDVDYALDDGCVLTCTILNGGQNYTEATVTFSDPEDGITAEGYAIINYEVLKELSGLIICNLDYDTSTPANVVVGVNTKFQTEVSVGDLIRCPSGILGKVSSIQSNIRLTLDRTPVVSTNRTLAQVISGYISDIVITKPGFNYTTSPIVTIDGDGTDAEVVAYTGYDIFWDINYCGTLESRFSYNRVKSIPGDAEKALIRLYPGPVAKYPGYYDGNLGFLSDDIYLQDGKYYQEFSYVIKSDVPKQQYDSYIRTTVHPTGKLLFGEYTIDNRISIDNNIDIEKIIKSKYTTYAIFDSVGGVDSFEFTDVTYSHVENVVDNLSAMDYGVLVNNPYTVPNVSYTDKMWMDYTIGDIPINID